MFATIVGLVLALCFLGLPLAIIGLFIMSIFDRSNKRDAAGEKQSESDEKVTHSRRDRSVRYVEWDPDGATAKRREKVVAFDDRR
jgi:hypothetical protein